MHHYCEQESFADARAITLSLKLNSAGNKSAMILVTPVLTLVKIWQSFQLTSLIGAKLHILHQNSLKSWSYARPIALI